MLAILNDWFYRERTLSGFNSGRIEGLLTAITGHSDCLKVRSRTDDVADKFFHSVARTTEFLVRANCLSQL